MPDDLYALAKKFQTDLLKGEAAASDRLAFVFVDVIGRLEKEIKALESIPNKNQARLDHILRIRDSIRAQAKKIPSLATLLKDPVATLGPSLAEKHAQAAAIASLGPKYANAINTGGILAGPGQNVQTFAGLASTPALQGLFTSIAGQLASDVEKSFAYHLAKGTGTAALARELRHSFDMAKLRSATVARTELLRSYRETSRQIYEQNADLVKGYIWVARLTSRTCAVCWAMHGTFHKTQKAFGTHPNCRCVMIPFMGGKNPVTLGPTVFKNLPEAKQRAILGKKKLELYKAGVPLKYTVGFKQHPTWGPTRFERSAADMATKVAIPGALGEDKLPAGTHVGGINAVKAAAKAKLEAESKAAKIQAPDPTPTPPPIQASVVPSGPPDPIEAKRTGGKKLAAKGKQGKLVVQAEPGTYQVGQVLTVKTPAGNIKQVQVVDVGKEFPAGGVMNQYHYLQTVGAPGPAVKAPKYPQPWLDHVQAIDPEIGAIEQAWAIESELGPENMGKALDALKKYKSIQAGGKTSTGAINDLTPEEAKLILDYKNAKQKALGLGTTVPPATPPPAPAPAKTYVVDKKTKYTPPAPAPPPKHPADLDHDLLKKHDLLTDATPWGSGGAGGFGSVVFDDDGKVLLRRNKGDYQGIRWTWAKVNQAGSPVDTALDVTKKKLGVDGQITGFVPGSHKGGVRYFMMRAKSTQATAPDPNTEEIRWVTVSEAQKLIQESTDVAGRDRDLAVLTAAQNERQRLLTGKKDQWTPPPPPPPPPPAPWEKPPVKVAKYKAPKRPDDFPEDPKTLRVVSKLGGSTGAELVEDPATGKRYVRKRGASADHVREEFVADEAYRALGVPVPRAHLYEDKAGPVKLAEYIDGTTLDKLAAADPKRLEAELALKEHMAIDALLGNYDVVGLNYDNILVGKDGKVYRIDNGGSLTFRAQGAKKDRWDEHVSTLWTLRGEKVLDDDGTQPAATSIFGDLGAYKLRRQIDKISETAEKKMLAALPDHLRDTVQRRLKAMRDVARHWKALESDDWVEDYADLIGKHVIGLRAADVTRILPKQLKAKSDHDPSLYDETGKKNDHLTNEGIGYADRPTAKTLINKLESYYRNKGTSIGYVSDWQSAQAGHSWNSDNVVHKHFLSHVIKLQKGEEYWHDHKRKAAETEWAGMRQAEYREAQAINKAVIMELLDRTEIPNVDRATGTIRLIRSENSGILPRYGITPGQYGEGLTIKRGLSESYSLINPVSVHGSEYTIQVLPYTRVNGMYFLARSRDTHSQFLGDGENEISAIWRSKKDRLDYVPHGKVKTHKVK